MITLIGGRLHIITSVNCTLSAHA